MIPDNYLIYKKFITEDERIFLLKNTLHLFQNKDLKPNNLGPHRFYKIHRSLDELNSDIHFLYERVVTTIGLKNPIIDPFLGITISLLEPGGEIHEHTDPYAKKFKMYSGNRNIRLNVMIERGNDVSYNPIVCGQSLEVYKTDAWFFEASRLRHKTEKISGPENRIVYQFGFMLNAI